jgi:hypothetical protein
MERSFKTDFVSALLVNAKRMESVLITQFARKERFGMENNVSPFHVIQVLHLVKVATAAKFQFLPAQLVLIGMDSDAFISQISAQQV